MAKEILLYGGIYSSATVAFLEAMEAAKDEDVRLRVNTRGGSVEDMWGIAAKLSEHKSGLTIQVDGAAHSSGAFALCYADKASALDVSEFLIHRAGYSEYLEQSDSMTEAMWQNLDRMNASLRKALEAKIDVAKFESLKKVTLDQVFSNDTRLDVFLSAKEAKQIGLIDEIVTITPKKKAEINALAMGLAASSTGGAMTFEETIPSATPQTQEPKKTIKMTIEEIRASHPEAYAQAVAVGVAQERDRVGAWMAYVDVDAKVVAEGITKGENLTQKATAELNRKQFSQESLAKIEAGNADDLATNPPAGEAPGAKKGEEENKVDQGADAVLARLGINAKKS